MLGQFIKEANDATEALEMAHLNFDVKVGEVFVNFTPKGCKAVPGTLGGFSFIDKNGEMVGFSAKKGAIIPGYKCVYRDDTKDIFDIVTDRYEVVQNIESLDVIYGIIKGPDVTDKNQIVIETAGALNKGETIFVTAKMPSYIVRVDGKSDPIDKYIVFTSSHDKSGTLTALLTDIRVVCNNTLQMALGTQNKVSIKHTKNVRERFYLFGQLLGQSTKYTDELKTVLEHLGAIRVSNTVVRDYVYSVFVPDEKRKFIDDKNGDIDKVSNSFISNRLKNKVNEVRTYIEKGPGQDFAIGTAYWMYNGITSYIHNGMTYSSTDTKFNDILISGSASTLLKKAYDKVIDYVRFK
jgi:phage/plasmid-like protein (TIGR03299 family)